MANFTIDENSGAATGGVRDLLRWEGAALFIGMTFFFWVSGAPWQIYAIFFFVPDLSFLAYLAGPRVGAAIYNTVHATVAPLLLALGGMLVAEPLAGSIALVWFAHIGLDRALGYGLKYDTGFRFTHLGRIGKGNSEAHSRATTMSKD